MTSITRAETHFPQGDPLQNNALILHLVAHPTLDMRLQELFDLLRRYRGEKDPLSLRISNWGREFVLLLADGFDDSVEVLVHKIDQLRSQILVNAVDAAPLRNPVLVECLIDDEVIAFVFEEKMLAHLSEIQGINPFDGEDLVGGGTVYAFGRDLLLWIDACLQDVGDEELQEIAAQLKALELGWNLDRYINLEQVRFENPVRAMGYYTILAQQNLRVFREERWQRIFSSADITLERFVQNLNVEMQQGLASIQETLRHQESSLEVRLDALEEINQRIREAFEMQIAQGREDLARLRQTIAIQGEEIGQLHHRVEAQSHEIQDLRCQNEQNRQLAQSLSSGNSCVIS